MAISTLDLDIELLICELSASLIPSRRSAFEAAARAAISAIPESQLGPGAAFRALRDLQRLYFDPPDLRADMQGARHQRPSKLADGPPIGEPSRPDRARSVLFARSETAG